MGMIGGGPGAFIGEIHRMAAALDGQVELVCGVFSRDLEKSLETGRAFYLEEQRVYANFLSMMQSEAELAEEVRMDFVVIVTPNHLHFPIAMAALAQGFHVLSDKPATLSLGEARALADEVARTGLHYGLTHTYVGYPMIKEAQTRVAQGHLGTIKKVMVEYSQGWLASSQASQENKQAAWRLDPAQAGVSSAMGDIGVHAAHLAEYVSGQLIQSICADLTSFVDDRVLDDDGSILLRFNGGAKGVLSASQVSVGEENNIRLRIYGDKGGLEWQQQEPNTLLLKFVDQPSQILRAGGGYLSPRAIAGTRTPMGHPEGYIEAFANLYLAFVQTLRGEDALLDIPGIEDAVRGMAFIEAAVTASESDTKWHDLN
jgi:predicted dehydrogenase